MAPGPSRLQRDEAASNSYADAILRSYQGNPKRMAINLDRDDFTLGVIGAGAMGPTRMAKNDKNGTRHRTIARGGELSWDEAENVLSME